MGSRVPPSPTTPDALLLGLWVANGHAAATGAVRDWQGNTVPDVLACTGQPWTVLVQALTAAEHIDVANVVILTNDVDLVRALSPPFRPPAPSQRQRIFYSRSEWVDVGWGAGSDEDAAHWYSRSEWVDVGWGAGSDEDAAHWQALQLLGGRWGGRFRAMVVDDLPKARQLWQQLKF